MNFRKNEILNKEAFEDGFSYALKHLERKCPHFMYNNDMECIWYSGYDSALKNNKS